MKSKLMLFVALAFGAVQAQRLSMAARSAGCRAATPQVAPSISEALRADSLNVKLMATCYRNDTVVPPGTPAYQPVGTDEIGETDGACAINSNSSLALVGSADTSGLYIFDIRDKENPYRMGHLRIVGSGTDGVCIKGDVAYVTNGYYLTSVDISDPAHPVILQNLSVGCYLLTVRVYGDYAYCTDYVWGIRIVDISDPSDMSVVGECAGYGGNVQKGGVTNGVFFVGCFKGGVQVFDVNNVADPSKLWQWLPADSQIENADVHGNYGLATGTSWRMFAFDLTDPNSISVIDTFDLRGYGIGTWMDWHYAVNGCGVGGVEVIDVTNPHNLSEAGHYDDDWPACQALMDADYYVYASSLDSIGALRIYNFYDGGSVLEEGALRPACSSQLAPTIVRGVLFLAGDGRQETGDRRRVTADRPALLDAAGRRVMELQPGPNDVEHLSPGVYFVSRPGSVEKVLLTR